MAVTDEELAALAEDLPLGRSEIEAIKTEINACGEEPAEVALRALSENRVLGLGEIHLGPNAHRIFFTGLMSRLKAAGTTHLALEIDVEDQPALDRFTETGMLSKGDLPCLLRGDDYMDMLVAARAAGLTLVAVDTRGGGSRDRHMANAIATILDTDPQAKVLFWVGSGHLLDRRGGRPYYSAAALLREKFSVCTIRGQTYWNTSGTLVRMTKGLAKPVAVCTTASKLIGELQDSVPFDDEIFDRYRYWDYAFIYPPGYGMGD